MSYKRQQLQVGGCARGQQPIHGKRIKAKETQRTNIPGRLKQNRRWLGQRNKNPKLYIGTWIQGKAQTKMGRQYNTGYPSTEYKKLDSLCPGSNKMEKCRWEGQNV